MAAPLRRRQSGGGEPESSASSASSASPASPSAETTSSGASETSATADATESETSSNIASITSSASASASVEVTDSGGKTTVFSIVEPPQHTRTATTPYTAHGVNATSKSSTTVTSTQTYANAAASLAASAKMPGVPENELTACSVNGTAYDDGTMPDNGPFCSPIHLQNMWVGYKYAITWNPYIFAENATNTAEFRYVDSELGNAWTSDPIPNYRGYVDVEMSKDWLKGASGNNSDVGQNMTLYVISEPLGGEKDDRKGPQIALVVNPETLPRVYIKNLPAKYGLQIGLPIGLAAFLIIALGIWCGIRKNNSHHRSIRGVSKDYMAKRARRRGRGGDIALEDYGDSQYTDQPLKGGGNGNAFRDEVKRQRAEDDASLRRYPSSY